MHPYRIYFLDSEDHILKVEQVQCANDVSAIGGLEALCDRRPRMCPAVEIWCRDRMVYRQDLPDARGPSA